MTENDNAPDKLIIGGLAAVLHNRPNIRLDQPDEVFRFLFTWGINHWTIHKYLDRIIERAKEMRASAPPTVTVKRHGDLYRVSP
jgi:hypothetical protein